MRVALAVCLLMAGASTAEAEIYTEAVRYMDGTTELEGYLAYDDELEELRPGVLVVHDWMGIGPFVKERAELLADLGYVALAVDMYGVDVHPKDQQEAAATAAIYKDTRERMRARIRAAMKVLQSHRLVDHTQLAAIGYCFGGTTVLELARSGADVRGVVSFHGGLSTPDPALARNIAGRVLALHGTDDPFVKPEEVAAFEEEMRQAGVNYRLIQYPGAVHGFTNYEAGSDSSKGFAYNRDADEQSWKAMHEFLIEVFQ